MTKHLRVLAVSALALAAASPVQAEFRAKTPHFVVLSRADAARTRVFAAQLEQFDAFMRILLKPPADDADVRPLAVFLLPSASDLRRTANLPARTLGYYGARDHGAYLVSTFEEGADANGLTAQQVLFHEYAHHLMLRYFPNAYPGWFVEGFAQLYSTVEFGADGKVLVGKPEPSRLPQLARDGLYPLDRLLSLGGSEIPDNQLSHYYGTAWLLSHYLLVSGARPGEFDRYLRAVAGGEDSLAAAEKHFIGGVGQLRRDLEAYRRSRFSYIQVQGIRLDPAATTLTELSPASAALFVPEILWYRGPPAPEAAAYAAAARAAGTRFAEDPYALTMLAEADRLSGAYDAAEAKAARATAIDSKLGRAWMVRAQAAVALAEHAADPASREAFWTRARTAVVAANRADPDAPEPLVLFYRLYRLQKLPPTDLALDGLLRAQALVPQNSLLRLEAASALGEAGQRDKAIALIRPLFHAPHDTAARRDALALQARLQASN